MKENQPNLPKQTLPEFLQFGETRMDLLEILFERMPMGIVVFDRDLKIVRCNPTWAEFIERYTPSQASDVLPGKTLAELAPGAETFFMTAVERVLQGEAVYVEAMRSVSGGIESFWDVAFSPLYQNGEVVGILDVTTDATERIQVLRNLENRVEERTREVEHRRKIAESMRDIIGMINSHMPLDEFLQRAVKLAAEQLGAGGCVLHHLDLENEIITHVASYGMDDIFEKRGSRPFSALRPSGGEAYLQALLNRQPTYRNYPPMPKRLDEIQRDAGIPEPLKRERISLRKKFAGSLSVPLYIQDRLYGGMVFYYTENQDFDEEQIQLGLIFAEQMAVAIENARLFQDTEQRRNVAESLSEILEVLNSTQTPQKIFNFLTKRSAALLAADACLLYRLDNELVIQESEYNLPHELANLKTGKLYQGKNNLDLINLQPIVIHDATNYLSQILDHPDLNAFQINWYQGVQNNFKAYLGIPLTVNEKFFGGLVFYYKNPHRFTEEEVRLARTLGAHSVLAIENARLFQEAERRRNVAESLRETLSILNTERPLEEILQHIVSQAQVVLQAKAVAIHQLDVKDGLLNPQAAIGLSPEYVANIRLPVGQGALGQAVVTRKPVAVHDTSQVFTGQQARAADGQAINLDSDLLTKLHKFSDRYGAILAVPMTVKNQVYGGLALYYATPRTIQPEEIQLAVTFANQASLAIENALLRAQATEAATLSERNRLARDLHDAVSQTLFSASLIADVLPKLWQRNPDAAQQKLNELGQLTRGALSEMRTLLLELRPTSLADIDLGDLLRHLVNAFIGRTRTPAVLEISGQMDPPAEVKSVFYRVAQEALNNIGKHAQATQVKLHLARAEGQARLEVRDNGRGFNPNSSRPGSLGLGIMRERAESIAAQLTVESRPGGGTKLVLTWKQQEK
jgi:PAS domain S-box-containing protein